MRMGNLKVIATVAAVGLWSFSGVSQAAGIDCQDTTKNYMTVDDSQVSACLAAGLGNIGNGQNDDFLDTAAGDGWFDIGDGSITAGAGTSSGSWSIPASFWTDPGAPLAIGFKFGTGNTPDEWFIYLLVDGVTSGDFLFTCTLCKGNGEGGISHIVVYGGEEPGSGSSSSGGEVPEPGTLGLLGLGLLGIGFGRRLRKTK